MRLIAALLSFVPIVALAMPSPLGEEGGVINFAGTYSDCSTQSFLPDIPPTSIVITSSFNGGVHDVVVNSHPSSVLKVVKNTFIGDGKVRNMFVQEFGIPIGASRMVTFEAESILDRMVVEQSDDLFGTIVQREISIELYDTGRLDYNVAFGPFIVYSVRCDAQ